MELKTVSIKGKDYVQVNDRLKAFRTMPEFAGWSLTTEVVELKEDSCTMKAIITDNDGKIRATGYAREAIAKSPINKFAFVENCETSAWGRALGNLGIGIDTAVCSAEELLQKMSQDDFKNEVKADKAKETRELHKKAEEYQKSEDGVLERFNGCYAYIKKLNELIPAGRDKVVMDKAMVILNDLQSYGKKEEYDKLYALINEKLPKDDDEIPTDICNK